MQRAKRFSEGSVKEHRDNDLTQNDLLQFLSITNPEEGYNEQVEGWNRAEHARDPSTPFQRQLPCTS